LNWKIVLLSNWKVWLLLFQLGLLAITIATGKVFADPVDDPWAPS